MAKKTKKNVVDDSTEEILLTEEGSSETPVATEDTKEQSEAPVRKPIGYIRHENGQVTEVY